MPGWRKVFDEKDLAVFGFWKKEAAFNNPERIPNLKSISNWLWLDWKKVPDQVLCLAVKIFGWSDLGSWNSLYMMLPQKDEEKNVVGGKCNSSMKTENCYNQTPISDKPGGDSRFWTTLILVKRTGNVLLICKTWTMKRSSGSFFVSNATKKKGKEF